MGYKYFVVMMKRISMLLCMIVAVMICACENTFDASGDAGTGGTPEESGVGTCVPVTFPDEFIFLSWYEIIDIYAENMLEEYLDPSAEWRMRKLAEAGFNTYFDYRLNSLEEAEALLALGDKTGMKIILECPELHDSAQTEKVVAAMSAIPE